MKFRCISRVIIASFLAILLGLETPSGATNLTAEGDETYVMPFPVNQIQITSRFFTIVEINWSEYESGGVEIIAYETLISEDGEIWSGACFGKLSVCGIDGLKPNTTYFFKVRASSAEGWGDFGKIIETSTTSTPDIPPSPVAGVMNQSKGGKNILSWCTPYTGGAQVIKYELNWRLSTKAKWSDWIPTGTKRRYITHNWQKGRTYFVKIRTTTLGGKSISMKSKVLQSVNTSRKCD